MGQMRYVREIIYALLGDLALSEQRYVDAWFVRSVMLLVWPSAKRITCVIWHLSPGLDLYCVYRSR